MSPEQQRRIVERYISSAETYYVARGGDDPYWASNSLYELASSDPGLCLTLCVEIAKRSDSDLPLESLANGPLNDVLKRADPSLLSQLESAAREDKAVGKLLSYVWEENKLPSHVWSVVLARSET